MIVTEGKASRTERRLSITVGSTVLLGTTILFYAHPGAAEIACLVATSLGVVVVVRSALLSVNCRRRSPKAISSRKPSPVFLFIIPCLNELPALSVSVARMLALTRICPLKLCYVCESDSTDGTSLYLEKVVAGESHVILLQKDTPPSGRGAAIAYALDRVQQGDVVGFLDADHYLCEKSVRRLQDRFSVDIPPAAVQGISCAANGDATSLARLLSIEQSWVEKMELNANPSLGGISLLGGGQGFILRRVLQDPRVRINPRMVLDDIDLSVSLIRAGHQIVFDPEIKTISFQPQNLSELLDQRIRWTAGWLQLSQRRFCSALAKPPLPILLRADLIRHLCVPYAGVLVYIGFAAAISCAFAGPSQGPNTTLLLVTLLWPLCIGVLPLVAGTLPWRRKSIWISFFGLPMLFGLYAMLFTAACIMAVIFRRQPRYTKVAKYHDLMQVTNFEAVPPATRT